MMISASLSSRNNPKGERGASVIEFALISSLMVVLLFGIMAYGEILADYVQMRYRLGEISREVSVGENAQDRQQIYNQAIIVEFEGMMSDRAGCPGPTFSPSILPTVGQVTITVTYPLTDACRVMPHILPIPDELRVQSSFTIQQ